MDADLVEEAPLDQHLRRAAAFLPNIVTLTALIFGLTAIRFCYEGRFGLAILAILAAAALDFTDGLLARRLRAESPLGAELDSLADFVNFGVAPGLFVYERELHLLGGVGWTIAAAYVVATGLRLARFNVQLKMESVPARKTHFHGLPSPAAAISILFVEVAAVFALPTTAALAIVSAATVAAGALMLSPFSFPTLRTFLGNVRRRLV
jgi:CDP-diacylglycerol--serine O-phosphatidyltransferase